MGCFGHFCNLQLRPRLALELATGSHVDRSQPATLMSFATPFAVPRSLEEGLATLHRGLSDRRFSLWLQVRGERLSPGPPQIATARTWAGAQRAVYEGSVHSCRLHVPSP